MSTCLLTGEEKYKPIFDAKLFVYQSQANLEVKIVFG